MELQLVYVKYWILYTGHVMNEKKLPLEMASGISSDAQISKFLTQQPCDKYNLVLLKWSRSTIWCSSGIVYDFHMHVEFLHCSEIFLTFLRSLAHVWMEGKLDHKPGCTHINSHLLTTCQFIILHYNWSWYTFLYLIDVLLPYSRIFHWWYNNTCVQRLLSWITHDTKCSVHRIFSHPLFYYEELLQEVSWFDLSGVPSSNQFHHELSLNCQKNLSLLISLFDHRQFQILINSRFTSDLKQVTI